MQLIGHERRRNLDPSPPLPLTGRKKCALVVRHDMQGEYCHIQATWIMAADFSGHEDGHAVSRMSYGMKKLGLPGPSSALANVIERRNMGEK